MNGRIGFMQGRLSPLVDGRIQSFPWATWEQEFEQAQKCGISLMEWTLDQDRLYQNPLLIDSEQSKIRALCAEFNVSIPSLTGDCFMQAPFWKTNGEREKQLKADFIAIVEACSIVGIKLVVVPLVDNGRLESKHQEDELIKFLLEKSPYFQDQDVSIIFESDFDPYSLAKFIQKLPIDIFGINYDVGNSASLGYNPKDEFMAYGNRVINVHIKDRLLGGTTVPLGAGNADFRSVFLELARLGYSGNFILQTARAANEQHIETLCSFRDMARTWILNAGLDC